MADNMTKTTARDQVLGTTELLENILLHLTPFQVLVNQRVSRRFLDCITTSPAIQCKLFFKAATTSPKQWLAIAYKFTVPHVTDSHLYDGMFTVPGFEAEVSKGLEVLRKALCTPLEICPALAINGYYTNRQSPAERACDGVVPCLSPIDAVKSATRDGSWEQMFFTDPPTTRATVTMQWVREGHEKVRVDRVVEDEGGLKMGVLATVSSINGAVHVTSDAPGDFSSSTKDLYCTTAKETMALLAKGGEKVFELKVAVIRCQETADSKTLAFPAEGDWVEMASK